MSGTGGTEPARKVVRVGPGEAATVIATLAEALGYDIRGEEGDTRTDLKVVEATRVEALKRHLGGPPTVAVAPRRLRAGEAQRLLTAGAARVLDAEACLLEAAFALNDLLFETCREQRRYAETFGGVPVAFAGARGAEVRGWLTGLSRRGGHVQADSAPPEGACVTLNAELGPWEIPMCGRIMFVDDGKAPGFGFDFALEQEPLVPCLDRFWSDDERSSAAPRRAADGLPA